MPSTHEVLHERARYWRSASRYRVLSTLFRENGASERLLAVARSLELQLAMQEEIARIAAELHRQSQALRAEVETLRMRMNGVHTAMRVLTLPSNYSPSDLREEARVCMEEAKDASADPEMRRSIAACAFDLAQLAEAVERKQSR